MLSAVVSGTDPAGDHWTLRLIGPGTLHVSDTKGNSFTAANAATPDLIGNITVSGTDSIESRLYGTVQPAAGSTGQVYFQNLLETGGGENQPIDPTDPTGEINPAQPKNGLLAIVMPDFWLGNTSGTVPTPPATGGSALAGAIKVPDGVSTLNFGGVNVDYTPAGGTPLNTSGQDNHFEVNLGTPYILGSSIIVNQVISDSEPGVTSSSGTAGSPTQDSVYFAVAGRVNLFQANEILGNTTNAPTQFTAAAGSTTGTDAGGTYLISGTGSPPFFIGTGGTTGALTGQIGNVRIGGNATNFSAMVYDNSTGNGINENAKIANFSIGGETQNILVVAPNGLRNAYFGQGMDETQINAYVIQSLSANRGAIGSNVDVSRGINSVNIGGDVVQTNIQSGYDLGSAWSSLIDGAAASGTAVPTIVNRQTLTNGFQLPQVIDGGHINARIAGNVDNSVISASVEPNPNFDASTLPGTFTQPSSKIFPFGSPDNIIYQHGVINAKVEGSIDNSSNPLVSTSQPNQAFFAKSLHLKEGPTTPPNIPEEPYPATVYGQAQRGVRRVTINPAVVHPKGATALKTAATKAK